MDYRKLGEDIKKGVLNKAAPILIHSEEQLLLDYYEKSLVDSFGANALDVSVFFGHEEDDSFDSGIMNALDTFPMLSPVRIVIVRNHQQLSGPRSKEEDAGAASKTRKPDKSLAGYLSQMPETARLIFSSNRVNKTYALYKAIEKHGAVYDISQLEENDLRLFVLKRFKDASIEISRDVLDAFIYATGYLEKDGGVDLYTVENDAQKLVSYAASAGRAEATLSDVEECLSGILRTDDFAMLDAISSGRKADAISLLENVLAADSEAMFRLLSLLIGHFEIMLGYKELKALGKQLPEITRILGQRSEWRVRKLAGFSEHIDKDKLEWILGRLYETDGDVRSGNIRVRDALTVLMAEI